MLGRLLKHWLRRRRPSAAASPAAAALVLLAEGRLSEAETALRESCGKRPHEPEPWHLLGHVLSLQGRAGEAVPALERAMGLAPESAQILYNLAAAYRAERDLSRAANALERATVLQPDWLAPWLALAELHADQGLLDSAEDVYRRALSVVPDAPELHYNFAGVLVRCGLADEALVHYRRALALRPGFVRAYSNMLCALNYAGSESPESIRDAHFEFGRRYAADVAPSERRARHGHPHDRIRVGYVSPDFRKHVVGRLVGPALERHDRNAFAVYCYSDVKHPDARTELFRSYAAGWRDIAGKDDDAVAAAICEDEIDILVDLTGHTDDHRLLVFARKPAPLQVAWIGYVNTTGLRAIDYRITDAHADPLGLTEHLYSERLLRLPRIYLPCERPEEDVSPGVPPCLERGFVTFGSFNNVIKLSPATIALWARVLRAVSASRLLVITVPEGRTRTRLREAFAHHGVDPGRIEFRGRIPPHDFLRAHAEVDIALDTYPYHGTATTVDTLWMGVPVVTIVGPTHASRAGLSMLANAGLEALAAATPEEYVERAVELARSPPRLQALRESLRERVEASPIMDGVGFTRDLEAAYTRIWREYCANGPPPALQ